MLFIFQINEQRKVVAYDDLPGARLFHVLSTTLLMHFLSLLGPESREKQEGKRRENLLIIYIWVKGFPDILVLIGSASLLHNAGKNRDMHEKTGHVCQTLLVKSWVTELQMMDVFCFVYSSQWKYQSSVIRTQELCPKGKLRRCPMERPTPFLSPLTANPRCFREALRVCEVMGRRFTLSSDMFTL